MEFCSFGGQSRSLSEGLRAGLFRRLPPSSPPPSLGGDASASAAAAAGELPTASAPPSHDMKAVFLTARELCLALAHMHSLGVCHGDLSASNVLLSGCPISVEDDRGFIVKVGGGRGGGASVRAMCCCAAARHQWSMSVASSSRWAALLPPPALQERSSGSGRGCLIATRRSHRWSAPVAYIYGFEQSRVR